jgi:uncharacterized protein (DUF1778 family)
MADQKRFARALNSPPKPDAALKRAFAHHRKLNDQIGART